MTKDTNITEVLFRVDTTKDFKGTIFALLPYEISDYKGSVTSYQHIGQHNSADYNHCLKHSKSATNKEASELKIEMESIGYNLRVVTRRNYTKFLKAYNDINQIL